MTTYSSYENGIRQGELIGDDWIVTERLGQEDNIEFRQVIWGSEPEMTYRYIERCPAEITRGDGYTVVATESGRILIIDAHKVPDTFSFEECCWSKEVLQRVVPEDFSFEQPAPLQPRPPQQPLSRPSQHPRQFSQHQQHQRQQQRPRQEPQKPPRHQRPHSKLQSPHVRQRQEESSFPVKCLIQL